MLTYTFSRREKALLLVLAIILVAVVWFVFVYQGTADRIAQIDGEIAAADASATVASAQVDRMHAMQAVIDKQKALGTKATPIPTFDNMTALMAELNGIMGRADTYTLTFDDLDTKTSSDYVLRGVRADYTCGSMEVAEGVIKSLANSKYPCSIDSISISDGSVRGGSRATSASGSGTVTSSVHITFFEKSSSRS